MPKSVDVQLNLDLVFKELDKSTDTKLQLLFLRARQPTGEERTQILESVLNEELENQFKQLERADRERLITMSAKRKVLHEMDDFNGTSEVNDDNIESMIEIVLNQSSTSHQDDLWQKVLNTKEQFQSTKSSDLLKNQNGIEYQAKPVVDVIKMMKAKLFVKIHPTFQLPSYIDPYYDGDSGDLEIESGGVVSLNCPISQTLMSVPVRNGKCIHVYEEQNILEYKRSGNSICPECNEPLGDFKPDHIMTQRIASKKLQDSWGWRTESSNNDEVIDKL